jgi:hypothetical protein
MEYAVGGRGRSFQRGRQARRTREDGPGGAVGVRLRGVSNPASPVPNPLGTKSVSGRFAAVNKPMWLVPPRVVLQRRAPRTLLMHAVRSSARILLLLATDIGAFLLARAALGFLQESQRLEALDAATRWALPGVGYYGGSQMGVALLVGLVVSGAYRSGDNWRSLRCVLSGVVLAVGLVLWKDLWLRGVPAVVVHFTAAVMGLGGCVLFGRYLLDRLVAGLVHIPFFSPPTERVLLVGNPDDAGHHKVRDRLALHGVMEIVGWVSPHVPTESAPSDTPSHEMFGSVDDMWSVLQNHAGRVPP